LQYENHICIMASFGVGVDIGTIVTIFEAQYYPPDVVFPFDSVSKF
jgi:hypothetical protein